VPSCDSRSEGPGEAAAAGVVSELSVRVDGPVAGRGVEGDGLGLLRAGLEPALAVPGRPGLFLEEDEDATSHATTARAGGDEHALDLGHSRAQAPETPATDGGVPDRGEDEAAVGGFELPTVHGSRSTAAVAGGHLGDMRALEVTHLPVVEGHHAQDDFGTGAAGDVAHSDP